MTTTTYYLSRNQSRELTGGFGLMIAVPLEHGMTGPYQPENDPQLAAYAGARLDLSAIPAAKIVRVLHRPLAVQPPLKQSDGLTGILGQILDFRDQATDVAATRSYHVVVACVVCEIHARDQIRKRRPYQWPGSLRDSFGYYWPRSAGPGGAD